MLVYNLNLNDTMLRDLAMCPEGIYAELTNLIPRNLDKRIFNNTVYYYFDVMSKLPKLLPGASKAIRFQYMRYHQAPIYGDMAEVIFIPSFEGGKRIGIRNKEFDSNSIKRSS